METYILPKPLFLRKYEKVFEFSNPELIINGNDKRINAAAERLYEDYSSDTMSCNGIFEITFGDGESENIALKSKMAVLK